MLQRLPHESEQRHSTDGIEYRIIRSSRRQTLAIQVSPEGVLIRAPQRASSTLIKSLVRRKQQWIRAKIMRFEHNASVITPQIYSDGMTVNYLGRRYRVQVVEGEAIPGRLAQGRLKITVPADSSEGRQAQHIEEQICLWYQQRAEIVLNQKARQLAVQLGVTIKGIRLRRTKSKWGHCTRHNRLQFNWVIMVAPTAVVDYLIAHEVCHLIHHNHSANYWSLVEQVCPDYRAQRKWLRDYGYTLRV